MQQGRVFGSWAALFHSSCCRNLVKQDAFTYIPMYLKECVAQPDPFFPCMSYFQIWQSIALFKCCVVFCGPSVLCRRLRVGGPCFHACNLFWVCHALLHRVHLFCIQRLAQESSESCARAFLQALHGERMHNRLTFASPPTMQ